MAFSWSTVNKYDKLKYHTLIELRENADYLSDNAANGTNNTSENGAQKTTDNDAYRASFLNDNHITDYPSYKYSYDSTDNTVYNSGEKLSGGS